MTQMQNQSSTASGPQSESGADALSRLHKMSRTAGVGSQDYVAINPIAVTSILFGLASPLVVVFGLTLLIIPIVGVVLAIVAIRQVKNSNGTQTGKALGWMALLLALGSSGFYVGQEAVAMSRHRSDEKEIEQLIVKAGDFLSQRQFDSAYALLSQRMRDVVTPAGFKTMFEGLYENPAYGPIKSIAGNGYVAFDTEGDGTPISQTYAIIKREKVARDDRQSIKLRKQDGVWVIDQFGEFFVGPLPQSPAGIVGPSGPAH